jgi:hypothetical protein
MLSLFIKNEFSNESGSDSTALSKTDFNWDALSNLKALKKGVVDWMIDKTEAKIILEKFDVIEWEAKKWLTELVNSMFKSENILRVDTEEAYTSYTGLINKTWNRIMPSWTNVKKTLDHKQFGQLNMSNFNWIRIHDWKIYVDYNWWWNDDTLEISFNNGWKIDLSKTKWKKTDIQVDKVNEFWVVNKDLLDDNIEELLGSQNELLKLRAEYENFIKINANYFDLGDTGIQNIINNRWDNYDNILDIKSEITRLSKNFEDIKKSVENLKEKEAKMLKEKEAEILKEKEAEMLKEKEAKILEEKEDLVSDIMEIENEINEICLELWWNKTVFNFDYSKHTNEKLKDIKSKTLETFKLYEEYVKESKKREEFKIYFEENEKYINNNDKPRILLILKDYRGTDNEIMEWTKRDNEELKTYINLVEKVKFSKNLWIESSEWGYSLWEEHIEIERLNEKFGIPEQELFKEKSTEQEELLDDNSLLSIEEKKDLGILLEKIKGIDGILTKPVSSIKNPIIRAMAEIIDKYEKSTGSKIINRDDYKKLKQHVLEFKNEQEKVKTKAFDQNVTMQPIKNVLKSKKVVSETRQASQPKPAVIEIKQTKPKINIKTPENEKNQLSLFEKSAYNHFNGKSKEKRKEIQELLWFKWLDIDGKIWPNTLNAIVNFQEKNGLQKDWKVWKNTLDMLREKKLNIVTKIEATDKKTTLVGDSTMLTDVNEKVEDSDFIAEETEVTSNSFEKIVQWIKELFVDDKDIGYFTWANGKKVIVEFDEDNGKLTFDTSLFDGINDFDIEGPNVDKIKNKEDAKKYIDEQKISIEKQYNNKVVENVLNTVKKSNKQEYYTVWQIDNPNKAGEKLDVKLIRRYDVNNEFKWVFVSISTPFWDWISDKETDVRIDVQGKNIKDISISDINEKIELAKDKYTKIIEKK